MREGETDSLRPAHRDECEDCQSCETVPQKISGMKKAKLGSQTVTCTKEQAQQEFVAVQTALRFPPARSLPQTHCRDFDGMCLAAFHAGN
jgi:hypothetical protein